MSEINRNPDLADLLTELRRRIAQLEHAGVQSPAVLMPPQYTAANMPPVAASEGGIVYNTTAFKHQASDGLNWYDLY